MATETLIGSGRDCAPVLTGKIAPWVKRLIADPTAVAKLIDFGNSPVHVLAASEFRRNVAALLSVLQSRQVSGSLFFARKANKLPWFVQLAKEEGIGVDTASHPELQETLALGVAPDKIIVTAVGKSKELVSQAVATGCLLVIDNLDEITLAKAAAQSMGRVARVGLRFSGFRVNQRKIFSRFGLPVDEYRALLSEIGSESGLQLELLHAHLDRYDIEERAYAARQLIEVADCASMDGKKVSSIDLGGGILIRYLEKSEQWTAFQDELMSSVAGKRPTFTYMADGLGLYKVGEEVCGRADLYPAWNDVSKERFIAAILDHRGGGPALHKEISSRDLKLYFEPGRALLDNTGVTLARVTFRKRDTEGNLLIGLGMNRTNLRPFRAEFCVDPILLTATDRPKIDEGAFLVGNLCGEGDVIMRRKLQIGRMPEPGDIFCFVNTAGYLAHHLEVGTHGSPLPVNVLIDEDTLEVCDSFGN
ncbi:MAG: alanine racemase [Candidatus Obscuribacterales bacterium]|nr:alanine racemase [Candidatus Obscuribacterales bacterium]